MVLCREDYTPLILRVTNLPPTGRRVVDATGYVVEVATDPAFTNLVPNFDPARCLIRTVSY